MKRLVVVLGLWLLAVAAITVGYITERGVQWPEFWIVGTSAAAAIAGALLAPSHRARWLLVSPLVAIVAASLAWMVAFGWFVRTNHRESEAWLIALFTDPKTAAPGVVTCGRPMEETELCDLYRLAEARGGIETVDCFDKFPVALRGWECRASLYDGTSLSVDVWIGWSERWAHAYLRSE